MVNGPQPTGGQSLPSGQSVLVTPSGTIVGSAQIPRGRRGGRSRNDSQEDEFAASRAAATLAAQQQAAARSAEAARQAEAARGQRIEAGRISGQLSSQQPRTETGFLTLTDEERSQSIRQRNVSPTAFLGVPSQTSFSDSVNIGRAEFVTGPRLGGITGEGAFIQRQTQLEGLRAQITDPTLTIEEATTIGGRQARSLAPRRIV